MNTHTKGQKVEIMSGEYAGKTAFFDQYSKRGTEWCFVSFTSGLLTGAQIKLENIRVA